LENPSALCFAMTMDCKSLKIHFACDAKDCDDVVAISSSSPGYTATWSGTLTTSAGKEFTLSRL
jgi:hypothetical protein